MSEEIIKVLDALAEKVGLSIDWTSENVVPYLEKLCDKCVRCEIVTSIIWLIFWAVLGVLCCMLFKYINDNKNFGVERCQVSEEDNDDNSLRVVAYFGTVMLIVVSVAIVMMQVLDIATCFTFPEKIIIKELKDLYSTLK